MGGWVFGKDVGLVDNTMPTYLEVPESTKPPLLPPSEEGKKERKKERKKRKKINT